MHIDHVGVVVADLDEAVRLYVDRLGFQQRFRETVEDQGVELIGLSAGDSYVELLRPLQEQSPLVRFLGRSQTKLHHVAYRVTDIRAALAEYDARGIRAIDETPRIGARNRLVAFLHPEATGGVLIELCQSLEQAQASVLTTL